MHIVLYGATGKAGSIILKELVDRGHSAPQNVLLYSKEVSWVDAVRDSESLARALSNTLPPADDRNIRPAPHSPG